MVSRLHSNVSMTACPVEILWQAAHWLIVACSLSPTHAMLAARCCCLPWSSSSIELAAKGSQPAASIMICSPSITDCYIGSLPCRDAACSLLLSQHSVVCLLHDLAVCRRWQGELHGAEGQQLAWVSVRQLREYAMPAADIPLVDPVVQAIAASTASQQGKD